MARKQAEIETAEGQVIEQDGTLYFRVNRPIAFVEYLTLKAMLESEEERLGRKIVILPHSVDVVKA